jgi:hypothetical protein
LKESSVGTIDILVLEFIPKKIKSIGISFSRFKNKIQLALAKI